jgi:hypothetical protein
MSDNNQDNQNNQYSQDSDSGQVQSQGLSDDGQGQSQGLSDDGQVQSQGLSDDGQVQVQAQGLSDDGQVQSQGLSDDGQVQSQGLSDDDQVQAQVPSGQDTVVHVKKQLSSWNGDRPFRGAMHAYTLFMMHKLEGCIKYLCEKQENTYAHVRVRPDQELEIQLDDGTFVTYKFHVVHYGPFKDKKEYYWMSRYNIFENLQVYPPFRTLQVEMLQRGYYLVDESDPVKSKRMVIRLYKTCPPYPLYLWHGYGTIPTLGPVAMQNYTLGPVAMQNYTLGPVAMQNDAEHTTPVNSYISALTRNNTA